MWYLENVAFPLPQALWLPNSVGLWLCVRTTHPPLPVIHESQNQVIFEKRFIFTSPILQKSTENTKHRNTHKWKAICGLPYEFLLVWVLLVGLLSMGINIVNSVFKISDIPIYTYIYIYIITAIHLFASTVKSIRHFRIMLIAMGKTDS